MAKKKHAEQGKTRITTRTGNLPLVHLAKLFAFATDLQDDTLHIYTDGVILTVWGSADNHLRYRDELKAVGKYEEARSGDLSIFVLRIDTTAKRPDEIAPKLVMLTTGFTDHRYEDLDTIEKIVWLALKL